jgi:hypothetical protein
MKYMYGTNKSGWLLIALVCCVVLLTLRPCESSEIKLHLDFDASDPVEYRGRIMEINHEKAQLVVAEETILVVDLMVGNYRLATEVTDDAGNLEAFESFERGDIVLVQGFKDADGIVFAALLQKLKSRQAKRKVEITGKPKKKKGGKLGKN